MRADLAPGYVTTSVTPAYSTPAPVVTPSPTPLLPAYHGPPESYGAFVAALQGPSHLGYSASSTFSTPSVHGIAGVKTSTAMSSTVHGPAHGGLATPAVSTSTSQSHGAVTSSSHSVDTPFSTSSKSDFMVNKNHGYPSFTSYSVHEPSFPSVSYPQFSVSSHFPSAGYFPPAQTGPFYPNHPYFHPSHYQIPNHVPSLNRLPSPPSFHASIHSPTFRGPLPSPGYYSSNYPPPSPLFNPRYPAPYNTYSRY